MTAEKNFYTLGIRYFNEHIDMDAENLLDSSQAIEEEYGKDAKWDYIRGITIAMRYFSDGIDFVQDNDYLSKEEIFAKAEQEQGNNEEETRISFMKGVESEIINIKEQKQSK